MCVCVCTVHVQQCLGGICARSCQSVCCPWVLLLAFLMTNNKEEVTPWPLHNTPWHCGPTASCFCPRAGWWKEPVQQEAVNGDWGSQGCQNCIFCAKPAIYSVGRTFESNEAVRWRRGPSVEQQLWPGGPRRGLGRETNSYFWILARVS